MEELPLGLRHALEAGECVLFIGAGIGRYYSDSDGNKFPDGAELAELLATHFSIDVIDGKYDLTKISKIVELRTGRKEMLAFLKSKLLDIIPDENVRWLCSLKWKAIFTTNYDRGIQTAYDLSNPVSQNPKTFITTSDLEPYNPLFDVPIYHLHGAIFDTSKQDIIITDDDYSKFKEKRRMLFELLKKEFITSTIIYIGYSNRDPNWNMVLREIESEFYPSQMPTSYRIAPGTDPIDVEILKAKNIINLNYKYDEFVSIASASLEKLDDNNLLEKFHSKIPADLSPAFVKNPAALTRFLNSWEYVNQADFSSPPNLKIFLEGDRPNWALVGQGLFFERDVEEELYDELLEYATSTKKSVKTSILLSPAGYGITTLLMALAVKLVKDRAGKVFILKPGHQLLEGDVLFARSLFEEKTFFIVDNAADHKSHLSSVLQRFRETKSEAMFFLGERLNEWRQSYETLQCKEFLIEPLSDSEINRLLDFLCERSALNKLEALPRDLQFNAVKKNFSRELLVAMKEATEGNEFDAILEDEFRGINGDLAKQAYLIVCCFFQHGVYIRDSLLADLLNLNISELYDNTSTQSEGIIIYDSINQIRGVFGARARHRKIAEIVWERCGGAVDKNSILKNAIDKLNLNYPTDAKAFEFFYRSDKMVDSLSSIDEKLQFFEKACKKDPDSPYVRQHYSRMLYREEKYEVALSQIEKALDIDSKARILYHTKGLVLSRMAVDNDSIPIARKRMVQSENSYKTALRMAPKDPYCYQGLAQLYLSWAKKCTDQSEVTDYLSKAESIIDEGLRKVSYRDKLWIESAKIQEFLGDHPGYIRNLERAIIETPSSIVARYILGRAYRFEKKYKKAVEVLKPIITDYPDEFRSYVEYTMALHYSGGAYDECIATLRLSTLYGYSDPRFIALLGGLYYLNQEFTNADKVFEEVAKRDFIVTETNKVQFIPVDPCLTNYFYVKGKVVAVKAGYSLIEGENLPKAIICPGSKYKGVLMIKDLKIKFQLAFTAKGPIAINIEKI